MRHKEMLRAANLWSKYRFTIEEAYEWRDDGFTAYRATLERK